MGKERLWNRRFAKLLCIETMLQFGLYLTRPIICLLYTSRCV